MQPTDNTRILIIDDNPSIHDDIGKILGATPRDDVDLREEKSLLFGDAIAGAERTVFHLDSASQGQEGLELVKRAGEVGQPYALAFVDVRMPPGWDGVETIAHLWRCQPDLQVVLCTAYSDYSWDAMERHLGNSDNLVILKKPFDNIEVLQLTHALTRKWNLNFELRNRLGDLDRLVRERTAESERIQRLYAVLSQVNQAIVRARSRQEVLDQVCRAALTYGGFKIAWIGWRQPETQGVAPIASAGDDHGVLKQLRVFADDRPEGRGPTGTAIREGRPVVCNDLTNDPNLQPWLALAVKEGIGAAASFPIRDAGEVQGALVLYAGEPGFFRSEETRLLEEVASDVSFALSGLRQEAQRRQGEQDLRVAHQRLTAMFESARDAVLLADAETGILLDANREATLLLGRPKVAIIGLHQMQLHPSEQAETYQRLFQERTRESHQPIIEAEVVAADGRRIPVEISCGSVDLGDGKRGMQGIYRDLTARQAASAAMRQRQAKLDSIFRAAPIGIGVVVNQMLTEVNQGIVEMTGYAIEELLGQSSRLLYPTTEEFDLAGCESYPPVAERATKTVETRWRRKDGRLVELLLTSSPIVPGDPGAGTTFAALDITERKRLEEQFLRAQRLESIGTLASGVAHDLNNILTPILMAIELLRPLARKREQESLLSLLASNARRGADIVKQLLTFGRGLEGERILLQPRRLMREMAKIIRETFPKSIVLEQHVPGHLWSAEADATQFHQVLLNLCVNARDAMPCGGTLTLAAENVQIDDAYVRLNPDARPGAYVSIRISDTGCGIPPEILEKVFDPFFTTKRPGHGTGLGLATVLGIVQSHRGFMRVQTLVGRGSDFTIYWPALKTAAEGATEFLVREVPRGNGQCVLVVDDEEPIRNVAARMLEHGGYRALTAADGAEALLIYVRQQHDIQAVVTDMIMPVMDGSAVIQEIRKINPQARILAMSGLPAQEHEARKAGSVPSFLLKPFTHERFLKTLSDLLLAPAA